MNYNVIPTPRFKKEAKRLLKKYSSLRAELSELEEALKIEPTQGTPLGNNTYKIRLAIKSKGKGKSGGGRIITYILTPVSEVYLLSIYDKSEISTIDTNILKDIVKDIKRKEYLVEAAKK